METSLQNHTSAYPEFLTSNSEMSRRIRDFDWSGTSLGTFEHWPQSLRTILSICLNSNFSIAIYWGKDLTLLYNDSWSPIPGEKHPWALGRPAKEVWPDIWEAIEPQFQKAFSGEPGGSKDALLPMQRHGYIEECYFDFTFTPVYGEGGKVEGIFNAVIETTYRVINERRTSFLKNLAIAIAAMQTPAEVFQQSLHFIKEAAQDISFASLYTHNNGRIELEASSLEKGFEPTRAWPFAQILQSGEGLKINQLRDYFTTVPPGFWPEAVSECYIAPLKNSASAIVGFLVCGLSSRRHFDADYKLFIESISIAISTVSNNIFSLQEERKRTEALAEIDRAKTAFFSNISHEFRTPLTLMLGPLEEVLNDGELLSQKGKENLQTSYRNTLRLQKLVNTLLDFSRIEAGRMQPQFQPVDIVTLTTDLASTFRSAIEKAGMELRIESEPFVDTVTVDVDMWEKIVLNLLSNAFKYTVAGKIIVAIQQTGDELMLSVSDTGIGIPQDQLVKVFERFHRINNTGGRSQEGTGIGLSLVQELVAIHGGSISVVSEVGKGTTFTVAMPVNINFNAEDDKPGAVVKTKSSAHAAFVEEATKWTTAKATNSSSRSERKPTILVADDNADMRAYIGRLLADDYDFVMATNGEEALALLKQHQPALILSDVMMPKLDGFGLLQELRAGNETKNIPLIFLSARAGEEAKIEGLAAGANDYIVKPFAAKELLARVEGQLKLRESRDKALKDLYNLFQEVPFAVAMLMGEELTIEFINKYNLAIWQHTSEEVIGKSLYEVFPGNAAAAKVIHDEVFRTGNRFTAIEIPIEIWENGKLVKKWFNAIVDPLRNEYGKIIGQLATSIEITDQVEARKKAEQSERQLNELANAMPQLVWMADNTGAVSYYNNRVNEFAGANQLPDGNWQWAGLVHPDDLDTTNKAWQKAVKTGEVYQVEHRIQMKTGGFRWFLSRALPQTGDDGEIIKWYGTATDIDEQKQAEEKQQYLATLTQNIADAVIGTDTEFRITSWNKGAERIYGWKSGEVIGKRTKDIMQTSFSHKQVSDGWQKSLETDGFWQGEVEQKRKDGTTFSVLSSVSQIKDSKGDITGAVGVNRDITLQKQIEDKIRESEELFRSFSNNIQNLAWITDSEGWIYWYNQRWLDYTGMTVGDMQGWDWQKVHHPDHVDRVTAFTKEAWKKPEPFELTFPLRGADGIYRWFLTRAVPVLDGEGKIVRWIGTNTNIHEQVEALQKVEASEARFRTLVEEAPVATCLFTGKELKIEIANEKIIAIMGKGPSVIGKPLAEAVPELKGQPFLQELDKVFATGQTYEARNVKGELMMDGEVRTYYFDYIFKPLKNSTGEVYAILDITIDVTDHVLARKELSESEEKFRTLAQTLSQLVWVTDEAGVMEFSSNRWKEYTGFDTINLETFRQMTHPDDFDGIINIWTNSLQSGQLYKAEVRLKKHTGEYRWHFVQGEPIRNNEGIIVKWIGAFTDIQDQKTVAQQLEQVVAQRTAELQRSNEDLQQFAHVASHDLKEPIRKVRTFGSRLDAEFGHLLPEAGKTYLDKMQSSAERMFGLIDGVLNYSTINSLETSAERVELNKIIGDIESDLEVLLIQKKAHITVAPLPSVKGSSVLLNQLFYNLINNALKFSRNGVATVVTIQSKKIKGKEAGEVSDIDRQKEFYRLSVCDNGIGFGQEHAEKIFKTFTRLNSRDRFEGTGLGLALCKKIAERHGGYIYATAKEGEGACFYVLLPA